MATFTPGKTIPTTVGTDNPPNLIDVDPLPPGTYRFQLVVEDDQQIQSDPVIVQVEVRAKPIAVLAITPNPVPQGRAFRLVGDQSSPKDRIRRYIWTMLQ